MRWHASCKSSALGQAARCAPALSFLCARQTAAAGPPLCIRHFARTLRCRINKMPKMPGQKVVLSRGQMPVHSAPQLPLCLRIHPFARRLASPCRTMWAPVGAGNKEGTKRKGGEGLRASFRSDYTARRKRSASSRRCVPFSRVFSARAFDKWYEKRRG